MIYLRGKVYWYRIKITRADAEGHREEYVVSRSAHSNRRREAEAVEREHRRALHLGQVHPLDPWPPAAPPQAPALKDFAERFLKHARLHSKPSTARFYENCLRRSLVFPALAETLMSEVRSELIGKYIGWRQSLPSGNSVAALNAELRTLRRAFRLAEEWAEIPKAPVIHELSGNVIRERVIRFDEEKQYLTAASATLRDLALLAADTGLRPNSELFPLLWADVRLEASAGNPHGCIHVPGGKTDAARRDVPLTPRAQAVLAMRRTAKITNWYVFPGPGRSGHITTVQHAHERAVKRAEIEPFEFYCWRHTCGTRWAEAGIDKFTLARWMGHSSPRVAERYYIHVTEPHVAAGFERFLSYLERRLSESDSAGVERAQGPVRCEKGRQWG